MEKDVGAPTRRPSPPWVAGLVAVMVGPLFGAIFAYGWARRAEQVGEPAKYVWQCWAIGAVVSMFLYAKLFA